MGIPRPNDLTDAGNSRPGRALRRSLCLPPILRWASALLATALAYAVQLLALPQPEVAPFVFCFFSVALAAWLGGRGPGLLSVALTAAMANYAFVVPFGSFTLSGPGLAATWLYLFGSTPVALLCAMLREALLRCEHSGKLLSQQGRLLDLSQDAVFTWRLDGGGIESWNRGAEALYGFSAREALGRVPRELLRTRFAAPWPAIEAELRRSERWEGQLPQRTRDGATVTVWARLQLLRDAHGVERVLETVRDVTHAKAAEAALRESELFHRQALESIPGMVFTTLPDGYCDYQSQQWVDYTGVPMSEHLGDGWNRLLHPDDRPRAFQAWRDAVEGRAPYDLEYRVRRRDGVYEWFRVMGRPIRDGAGRIVRWFGVAMNIEALKRAETRLRRFYDAGTVGILYWTVDGRLTDANDKFLEMTGYSREDLAAGRLNWVEMTPPEWRQIDAKALESFRTTGSCAPYEKEYLRKDGSRIPIIVGGAMLDDERRTGMAFVVDISDRKQAEEALREADRRKNEFLGVLSHELRNPLAPIRNSLYLLRRSGVLDERGRWAATVIDRQVRHLTRLVDDLLDVTRIARGKIRLQTERLDLADLLRHAVEDYRSLLAGSGLELSLALPPQPLWVRGDAARLTQVVGNLLANASKFTPAGGRIGLTLGADDRGRAVVEVVDNGIGIDPETLSRLFQPFSQADRSLERSRGGLGLGLALAKGLVELHGGEIRAESEGEGRGARFTVALPMLAEAREPTAETAAPPPEPPVAEVAVRGRPRRRVLIVEDNRDAARTLGDALELLGHEVAVAYDGQEGVRKARGLRPEVVLCDIGLPGLDGYGVARAVREDGELAGVFLVALTGYARPEDLRHAAEAGFQRHLAKPPDIDAISRILDECCGAGRDGEPAQTAPSA
ncbi:MAG: PAS domain S-box protein [Myxococcales bacterium]